MINSAATQQPKVSVAMATYNGGRFLSQQLDTLLQQTHLPDEIVISDDGSSDDTVAVVADYQQKSSLIKLVHNPAQGINSNFSHALSQCSGDFVAFCDQDDLWHPEKIEKLLALVGDAVLAYGKDVLIDDAGRPLAEKAEDYLGFGEYQQGAVSPLFFLNSNCVSGHAMLIRRDVAMSALPVPDGYMFDQWFALCAAQCGDFAWAPENLVQHRIHASNSLNNAEIRQREKARKTKPTKLARFQRKLETIGLALDQLAKKPERLTESERDLVAAYQDHVLRADKRLFNWRLFRLLRKNHRVLFKVKGMKKSINAAMGGRFYRWMDRLAGNSDDNG